MKIGVVFDLEGDDAGSVRAAAVARALAPAGSAVALAAGGAATKAKTRAARLGLEVAALATHPALAGAGDRERGVVLAALARHLRVDVVLLGVPAAEDVFGLLPASLAQALGAPGLYRVSELAADAATPGALLATVRLGGRVRRLRVRPPVVLSLLPGAHAAAAVEPGRKVEVTTCDLATLGVDPRTLPEDPNAIATFTPLRRKPAPITDVAALLAKK